MELKMMFYLSNVAIAVNISQPSVRIGGGLHALIHIFFLHGGSKSPKPLWDLNKGLLFVWAKQNYERYLNTPVLLKKLCVEV